MQARKEIQVCLSEIIRSKLERRRLSIPKLALRTGASRMKIYRLVHGVHSPILTSDLLKVTNYLGIDLNNLEGE
ncbi:MAG: helix-turn-helix domain-containing protein [Bacteriovoracaceae bacterium]